MSYALYGRFYAKIIENEMAYNGHMMSHDNTNQ